jgi:hypothetical protein
MGTSSQRSCAGALTKSPLADRGPGPKYRSGSLHVTPAFFQLVGKFKGGSFTATVRGPASSGHDAYALCRMSHRTSKANGRFVSPNSHPQYPCFLCMMHAHPKRISPRQSIINSRLQFSTCHTPALLIPQQVLQPHGCTKCGGQILRRQMTSINPKRLCVTGSFPFATRLTAVLQQSRRPVPPHTACPESRANGITLFRGGLTPY